MHDINTGKIELKNNLQNNNFTFNKVFFYFNYPIIYLGIPLGR